MAQRHALWCIGESRSEEVWFYTASDSQPEKLGQYRNVVGLKIDPIHAEGRNIFRPWGWPVAMIVSERLKAAPERSSLRFKQRVHLSSTGW